MATGKHFQLLKMSGALRHIADRQQSMI